MTKLIHDQRISNQGKRNAGDPEEISLPGKRIGWIRKRKSNGTWQADLGMVNDTRVIKSSRKWTKQDAINWAERKAKEITEEGYKALELTDAQRLDAIMALKLIKDAGTTLEKACQFYVKHRGPEITRRTIEELADEYIKDAEKNGLRPRSIADIKHRCNKINAKFGNRIVNELSRNEAQDWLSFQAVSRSTKNHDRAIFCGMYNFAIARGYAAENPFIYKGAGRKLRKEMLAPAAFTWKDTRKIMQTAVAEEESIVPALAIGFFAGLRMAEIRGIRWENIDLENRRIHVPAGIAKSRRERHVTIEDNLALWLAPYLQDNGLVAPDGQKWRSRLDNIVEKSKVVWIHNGLRHSYASYHAAKYQDLAKTAFQLGHGKDVDMLEDHYKELRTPEEAAKYWNIRPNKTELYAHRRTA